jgi:hypothetical protein
MSNPAAPEFYHDVDDYLQQGDLFRVNVVTPYADREQRIFRGSDGRHGSVVFAEAVGGTVFGLDDLLSTLSATSAKTELHTQPFCCTFDGQHELVVVFGDLAEYFLIITQTCDVSGHDKAQVPYAMILPARTIINICRTDRVPLEGEGAPRSIEEYLSSHADGSELLSVTEPIAYFAVLRRILDEWKPKEKNSTTNRGRIRNFINKQMDGAKHVFYLRPDEARGIPDLFVEFSGAYTVDIVLLVAMSARRVARIGVPYREDFARAFADRISRIAVPALAKPTQIR